MLKNKLIISLIGIYIFWLFVLPPIITKSVYMLCEKNNKNSISNIKINNLRTNFSILPVIILKADNVQFKTTDELFITDVEKVKLKIRLLPLLSGRLHINSIAIGKVNLSTNLVEELELDKNFFKRLEKTSIKIDSINLKEFEAQIYQKDLKTPIIYNGKSFNYQRKNRYIRFKNNSTLNVGGNVSKIASDLYLPKNNDINRTLFDIEVSNINIAPLKIYFKHYLPKDLQNLEGVINLKANKKGLEINLENFAILKKDVAKSIVLPKKTTIVSRFNITRNYINFENVNIESDKIHLSLKGRLSDYFGKTMPTLDLNLIVNQSKVEDFIKMLPPLNFEEMNLYYLKKYKFYGDVLANVTIKGRLPEPEIIGDIYINNGILTKPIPNTTKGATIKLKMLGKNVDFDVIVPAGGLEKVWVKGSQELYNTKFADFIVKSTNSVDLKVAQNIVEPLHEILNFIIGPVPIMDISGKGNIDILVKGNRRNPHIWGTFQTKQGCVNLKDIPDLKLVKADSVLKFNGQNLSFTNSSGKVNDKDFIINGICDLFGKFDFDIKSENQPTTALYKALYSSTIVPDIKNMLPDINSIKGTTDFGLKVYGQVKDINNIEINKNVFAKGNVKLVDNTFVTQNIKIDKTSGDIKFESSSAEVDACAFIGGLPLNLKAKLKNEIADLDLDIPKLNPNFLISDEQTRKKQYLPFLSVKGKYNGSITNIDYSKLELKALILESIPTSKIKYKADGFVKIANNKIYIKDIKGFINDKQNTFGLDLIVNNAFDTTPDINGQVKLQTPDLSLYNEILESDVIPDVVKQYTKDYRFETGALDFKAKIANSKVNSFVDLSGMRFVYVPFEIPIEVVNGAVAIKNNTLKLNKVNLLADKMPVLVDGEIKDVFDKKNFNIYFNSKPQQEFIDKYINKNQIYPIKIKGDIVYWLKLKGVPNNYDLRALINLSKDSSIYHFGATVGDIENAIELSIDSKIMDGNNHKIREFSYDKIVDSQSGRQTRLNMLKAYGGVKVSDEDLGFENLRIKTNHPTDARIFNIIFRKPNIKQGQFTSDLKINGKLSEPRVLGEFHIFETNIPFLDTTMKNIELVFRDKTIDFDSKGEVIGNDITFNGVMKNKLTVPYRIEKAYLYTKDLDLDQIINKIKLAEVDSVSTFESFENFDIHSIVAKDFKLRADNITLRDIKATGFEALISLSENGLFDVSKLRFNIAQGILDGRYSYNINNNDMGINLKANSISANDLMWAIFDLKNQIYGNLTGDVNLTCNGTDFNQCMQSLSGNTIFNVKDGKMPKLGSLEYLLKAGNLIKGGFTSLSINGVIDLLTPAKTGEFSDIFGSIRIKDGVARNIEITTKGEDLSLFISGTYNFATSIADMEVLGLLSRKISTMFGPIGNVSINTLFNVIPGVDLSKDSLILERINKIPGIELSSKTFRKFIAEIKGNINGDDYVTSFKWIN